MARTGMAQLIGILRGYTDTSTTDYEIGEISYWSDDQLQVVLDRHRQDIYHELLHSVDDWVGGGTVQYLEYQSAYNNLEQTTGGSAIFIVEDGTGTNIAGTAYSVDYLRGRITFNTDTSGSAYYLTARTYDVFASAADVWRQKASHYVMAVDFSTDNHRVNRSQLFAQCMKMADHYEGLGGPQVIELYRSDTDVAALG